MWLGALAGRWWACDCHSSCHVRSSSLYVHYSSSLHILTHPPTHVFRAHQGIGRVRKYVSKSACSVNAIYVCKVAR